MHCHNQDFIQWCENNCFPIRNKTEQLSLPIEYSEPDFWRGVIDGDGSIGLKNVEQQPFLSLATKSELLKEGFCDYIHKLTGFRPNVNRNKRDNIFNETKANETHYIVGKNIRATILKNGGIMSEDMPTPDKSLKELEKDRNKKLPL